MVRNLRKREGETEPRIHSSSQILLEHKDLQVKPKPFELEMILILIPLTVALLMHSNLNLYTDLSLIWFVSHKFS